MGYTDTRFIDKPVYDFIRANYSVSDVVDYGSDKYVNITIEIQVNCVAWTGYGYFDRLSFANKTIRYSVGRNSGSVTTTAINPIYRYWQTMATINTQYWRSWNPSAGSLPIILTLDQNIPSTNMTLYTYDHISNSEGGRGSQYLPIPVWEHVDQINFNPSSFVTRTPVTLSLSHTYGYYNTIDWVLGSKSGNIANRSSDVSFTWTPSDDIFTELPNDESGTIRINQQTYDSSGNVIGNSSYDIPITLAEYENPIVSGDFTVTKKNYQNYPFTAEKTIALITFPNGVPSGTEGFFGAKIISKEFRTSFGEIISDPFDDINFGPGSIVEAGPAGIAGTLKGTLKVTDSRGRYDSIDVDILYSANQLVDITGVTSEREGDHAIGTVVGTFGNGFTPLSIDYSSSLDITITGPTISGTNFTYNFVTSATASNRSYSITFKVMDGLGNSDSMPTTVGPAFSYFELTPNRTIALGQSARSGSSNEIELGLETKTFNKIIFTDEYGYEIWHLDPNTPIISASGNYNRILGITEIADHYDSDHNCDWYLRRIYYTNINNSDEPLWAKIICRYWPHESDKGTVYTNNAWGRIYDSDRFVLPDFGITFDETPEVLYSIMTSNNGAILEGVYSTSTSSFGETYFARGTNGTAEGVSAILVAEGPYDGEIV